MLVADSKPLTKPHSSSEQPDKRIQQGGSEPYEMELASDTLWTHIGTNSSNLYAYLACGV